MIERLVQTLPIWKRLDAQLRTLASAKTLSDDENRRLRAQVEDLQRQLSDAIADGRKSREQVADWIAQYTFGRPVYGPLALPSERPTDIPAIPRRVQGRDLVARLTQEALHARPAAQTEDPR